ncbi:MAG: non-canonical purine NTP pyrophosphatase, RdgB/HAM1 family [Candidatus Marinimicrobia bacterium]|nr:non-canonical purine NTP pyrophosphatase, RdgB/HAM1 family [Candidatus Neomarinimicrobiota bacterium]|tara:strand:- start:1177 stop:1800 length:624 start_codon:yes stop_codon:yes gene_type:complete
MKIVIATRNSHKRAELKRLLTPLGEGVVSLEELDPRGEIPEVEETGTTLKENAFLKARAIFKATGLPAVSDDTGLEVEVLDGAPGVNSARYAGENCSYEDNINKLLQEMVFVPPYQRKASFRTVAAFVDDELELSAEGAVEGVITEKPEGFGGFGYDPVFSVENMKKSYAQLSDDEKNRISHRGKAVRNLVEKLRQNGKIAEPLSNI